MNYLEKTDYSSLSTYLDCQRKFYFQYILHFRSSKPSIHLVFGGCWHYGIEVVYQAIQDKTPLTITDATELSIKAFNDLWTITGESHFNSELVFPKSPGNAANMYYQYWTRFLNSDIKDYEVVAVEAPFVLDMSAINPQLPNYIGRIDLLTRHRKTKRLIIFDHKTTKAIYPMTFPGFEMSMQTVGYMTAGHIFYKDIPKMIYNMAICQKSKNDFQRLEIIKPKSAIERFLKELSNYLLNLTNDIKNYHTELPSLTDRTDFMTSFPRNPGYACTAYMSTCPYKDICSARANPSLWADNPPAGYTINEWDPDTAQQDIEEKLKQVSKNN